VVPGRGSRLRQLHGASRAKLNGQDRSGKASGGETLPEVLSWRDRISESLRSLFAVLANARTYNHRPSLLQTVGAPACSIRFACGYGSRVAFAEPVIGRAFARPVGSLARDDAERDRQDISRHARGADCVRAIGANSPSKQKRAQGRPGARRTHGPRATKSTRQNHRYEPDQPAFPAQWFYGLYVLSSVTIAWLPPSVVGLIETSDLSACVGAPGPHDFAVRTTAARPRK
jgi:hypothetical protein